MTTERALALFRKVADEIPAYQEFLRLNNCNPKTIKTLDDYGKVPITSKKNYLQKFPHESLAWPADWMGPMWFCSTSGSTGEPYYFPRHEKLAEQASWMAEMFINNSSYGPGRTLILIGFGMGVWIGGTFTQKAFEIAAKRNNAPLAILPVGYNKTEIFKALKKLSPQFEQTILVGYPPFIKEIVDESEGEGINLKDLHIRLVFAAEAFTETFRTYVCDLAGVHNPLRDTLNIYGTADIGAMAYETPLSILIRRLALDDPLLFKDIFGQIEKTPTLAQYNPKFIEFETIDGQIVLTGDNALPLVRYAIGDNGGTFSYPEIRRLMLRYNVDLDAEIRLAKIEHLVNKDPFVFVYERVDLAVTLHGMIIYPEFIKDGLLDPSLTPYLTERFTMSTKNDIHHNQFLQINIELRKDLKPTKAIERQTLKIIRANLIKKSSEFAEVSKSKNSHQLLQVILWHNGHPRYFAAGIKQKWVEKV